MSRVAFNQSRMFMRKSFMPTPFRTLSTCTTRFQQQQQQQTGKNTTHFGFRDVAEEDKESLGKFIETYEKGKSRNNVLKCMRYSPMWLASTML